MQGALVAPIVARLGEARTALVGLTLSFLAYLLFAFATSPVLFYVAILLSAFGGLVVPALQALLTGRVAEDEQGLLQGALASLDNLANVVAPPIAAGLFAFALTRSASGVPLGTPLLLSAALELAALIAVWSAVRRGEARVTSARPS